MKQCLFSAALVLISASWVFAFGQSRQVGGPPMQQVVRIDASGQMHIYYQMMMCIPETQTRAVTEKVPVTREVVEEVDGEVRKKTVTEYKEIQKTMQFTTTKTVCETRDRTAFLDKVKAFETDGKLISTEALKSRLKQDTLVVVSPNDQMIPDYYAWLFKPGTIIMAFEPEPIKAPAIPAPGVQAPAAPVPVPQAPQQTAPKPPSQTNAAISSIHMVSQSKDRDEQGKIDIPESAPEPRFPKTMAPILVFASREGTDQYNFRQLTESKFETTGYKIEHQGTGTQKVPLQMTQTIRHNEITTIAARYLQFFLGDGTTTSADRVKEKLSREATVVYSADGEPVDSFWLQNLKATTLVIVGPQLPACAMPMMGYGGYDMPMPAPVSAPAVERVPPPRPAPVPAPAKVQ